MPRLNSFRAALALAGVLYCAPPMAAWAQEASCKPAEIDKLIDGTGEYLRTFALKRRPLLHEKLKKLAVLKKWPPETAIERGYKFAHDDKVRQLDEKARKLLIELDEIGARASESPSCRDLDRLKTVSLELRTVTEVKFKHVVALVDNALKPAPTRQAAKPAPAPPVVRRPPPPKVAPRVASQTPPKAPAKANPWQTTTESAPPPAVLDALPPPEPMPVETTYTVEEIREAGRGFFGNISAGLASVLQYTFENYGRPNGYILGTEGGGAFLAGVSFGEGRLSMKTQEPRKVYWQSPTVGYDLGLQGSRVMILVYNLLRPEKIYRRYGGIGGSAYVVGGVGLTYHKRGRVVLAPIRTGLGLRLGANIGYLKFTPKFSINPF